MERDGIPDKVLITGGAGFIGSHLAEYHLSRATDVLIIDDLSTGRRANIDHLIGSGCQFVDGPVGRTLHDHPQLLDRVSHIYHLAASVGVQLVVCDPTRIIRNNIEETAAVFDAARRINATVLVASSSEVYGKSEAIPLREDGDLIYGPTTGPRWSYAMSKAIDEHLALNYHAQMTAHPPATDQPLAGFPGSVVVRLFNTIGPRQVGHYGMVVPRFVQAAVRGEDLTIYGDGKQTRSFCDVRDVVRAMIMLMDNPANHGGIFNIGSDVEITINQLADQIIALAGSSSGRRMVSYDEAYRPGFEDPFRRRVPDVSKLRSATGWQPQITLQATLRELIDTMRADAV